MKTTAKHCHELKKCAAEVVAAPYDYHAITKELLRIYTDNDLQTIINSWHPADVTTLQTEAKKCNLVIDVMDFTKFKKDIAMWRRVVTIYEAWVADIKEQDNVQKIETSSASQQPGHEISASSLDSPLTVKNNQGLHL